MAALFETFWFTLIQHFAASLAVPVMVGYHCRPRHYWWRFVIMIISYALLWILWSSLLSIEVDKHTALLVAFIAVYAFIRSVARLQQSLPAVFYDEDEHKEDMKDDDKTPKGPEQGPSSASTTH